MATTAAANHEGLTIQPANGSELQLPAAGDRVQLIPLDEIAFSPTNPRKHINQAELESLAESIRINGLLQPVTLRPMRAITITLKDGSEIDQPPRPFVRGMIEKLIHELKLDPKQVESTSIDDGCYEVVAGERRVRAFRYLRDSDPEVQSIPAIVRTVGDEEMLDLQIVENLQREDLTPLDWAAAYRARVDVEKLKQGEGEGAESSAVQIVAAKVGKSPSVIYQAMQLLNLIPEAQQMLRDRRMSKNHGIDCARLERQQQAAFIDEFKRLEKLEGGTPSVRDMRTWIDYTYDAPDAIDQPDENVRGTSQSAENSVHGNQPYTNLDRFEDVIRARVSDEDRAKLKRFEDAIGGRKLSGTAAFQINEALHGFGKVGGYQEGDKLNERGKKALQDVCNEMRAQGITPAETLLTESQQAAQQKKTDAIPKSDYGLQITPAGKELLAANRERTEQRYETIRADARKVYELARERRGAPVLVGSNIDLVAEALFDCLDLEDVQFLCELFDWVRPDDYIEHDFIDHIRSQYLINWARDHELFLVTAAALALSGHDDQDRTEFMGKYFDLVAPSSKTPKAAKKAATSKAKPSSLGKKNEAKLAKVAPAKVAKQLNPKSTKVLADPRTTPVKRDLTPAELASLPMVKKAAVHKPAKKAAKKSAKKGGRR